MRVFGIQKIKARTLRLLVHLHSFTKEKIAPRVSGVDKGKIIIKSNFDDPVSFISDDDMT